MTKYIEMSPDEVLTDRSRVTNNNDRDGSNSITVADHAVGMTVAEAQAKWRWAKHVFFRLRTRNEEWGGLAVLGAGLVALVLRRR